MGNEDQLSQGNAGDEVMTKVGELSEAGQSSTISSSLERPAASESPGQLEFCGANGYCQRPSRNQKSPALACNKSRK